MCFVLDNYDHLLKLQNLFSTLIKLERKITQVLKSNKQKQKRTWSVRQANLQGKTQKRRRNVRKKITAYILLTALVAY